MSPWSIQNGRAIAPVVMMVEGVACGSHGCLYWPSAVLQQNALKWLNIPVTPGHPVKDGKLVSVNYDAGTRATIVGNVKRPYYDVPVWALKAEIEIESNHPLLPIIHDAREVSIGVFSEENDNAGNFGGEQFEGTVTFFNASIVNSYSRYSTCKC